MKLQRRVVIVTGGGRGIGEAIALAFAHEGADVAVVSRTPREIEETAAQVRTLGRRGMAVKADVSRWDEVNCLVEEILRAFQKMDILVNNGYPGLDRAIGGQ